MKKTELGRLQKVFLREIWQNEAQDFTPWLAQEENLPLLGEALNIELEFEAQEKNIGPFRADILCKDTANGSWVLIENQIGCTDHSHLGQILTYASGLQAVTIVWIASKFTDEHRSALDWLNKVTNDEINFFGLEIELWRIGESEPAPKFNIISQPNEWESTVKTIKQGIEAGNLSNARQLQLDFWIGFREYILQNNSPIKPAKPEPSNIVIHGSIGLSGTQLKSFLNTRENRLGVILGLRGKKYNANFKLLMNQKKTIEEQIGSRLDWFPGHDKQDSGIRIQRTNIDKNNREEWAEHYAWMLKMLETFQTVFKPLIEKF